MWNLICRKRKKGNRWLKDTTKRTLPSSLGDSLGIPRYHPLAVPAQGFVLSHCKPLAQSSLCSQFQALAHTPWESSLQASCKLLVGASQGPSRVLGALKHSFVGPAWPILQPSLGLQWPLLFPGWGCNGQSYCPGWGCNDHSYFQAGAAMANPIA